MLPYLARRTAVSTWKTLRQTQLSRDTETEQHDDALPPQQLRAAGQPGRALLAAGGQHAADARRQHQPQVRHRAREVSDIYAYLNIYTYLQGESKKSGISNHMAITTLKSIRRGKVGVFWKIQLKCCRIGTKPSKIDGKWLRKMNLKLASPL